MHHPSTRAERRFARQVWRDHRRKHIVISRWFTGSPEENGGWLKGGKQYFAHGNRCMCHLEKKDRKTRRKARRERYTAIVDSLRSWNGPV